MKILLGQLSPQMGEKEANIQKIRESLRGRNVDLAIYGELFLTGYMCKSDFIRLAETVDGDSVAEISNISRETKTNIMFGMPELDERKKVVYNSSILVQPDGRVHTYRKLHLATFGPFEEQLYFGKGTELSLFEMEIARIGPIICFDAFFPELSKYYALKGADIIACISAGPSTSRTMFETVLPARAVENTLFVIYCNLVGTELNMVFHGGSFVIGPRGNEIARCKYYKEDIVECEIDLIELAASREARPTIRDTRFDVLSRIKEFGGSEGLER